MFNIIVLIVQMLLGLDGQMVCQLESLEMHGFEGAESEKVCTNIVDYTDFVVVETGESLGSIMYVKFEGDNIVNLDVVKSFSNENNKNAENVVQTENHKDSIENNTVNEVEDKNHNQTIKSEDKNLGEDLSPKDKVATFDNNNVGNGEAYTYKITEIIGDEIHGEPTNKISSDNRGILLFQDEVSFSVSEGDVISVIWGNEEDEFESITKVN